LAGEYTTKVTKSERRETHEKETCMVFTRNKKAHEDDERNQMIFFVCFVPTGVVFRAFRGFVGS
jgi:hypothetical protein